MAAGVAISFVTRAATTPPVDNAIAVSGNGQCAAVKHYFSSTYDTPILPGWTVVDPTKLYIYETPLGNCKTSPTADASCCRNLGLTYTDDDGWQALKTSTETVSICGGGLATNISTYCSGRTAETRDATVEESCYYSGLDLKQLVVNPITKYCSTAKQANAYSRLYTIDGKQLGTNFDVKDTRDYTKTPTATQCPVRELKGTVYQRQDIDRGLWFNGRFCDLSTVTSIGDCCAAMELTRVEPSAITPTSSSIWSAVIMISVFVFLVVFIIIIIIRRHRKPSTPLVLPPVPAPIISRHSWSRRWWVLIIILPVLAIIWGFMFLLLLSSNTVVGDFIYILFYYLIGVILVLVWWRRGRTGKVLTVMTILSALVLLVPPVYRQVSGGHNYVRVNRQAATDQERGLITQAELISCPANVYCAQPLAAIASTEASNAGPLDLDKIRLNIHSELDYNAQVSTSFPGTFTWPQESMSFGSASEPTYYDLQGQTIPATACQVLTGTDFHVVGMWIETINACPLCGSGGVDERRLYFNSSDEPVCQAILSYGQWIS